MDIFLIIVGAFIGSVAGACAGVWYAGRYDEPDIDLWLRQVVARVRR